METPLHTYQLLDYPTMTELFIEALFIEGV